MPDDRRARAKDLRLGLLALALAAVALAWLIPTFVRAPIEPRPLAMAPWFLPSIAAALFGLAGAALAVSSAYRARDRDDSPDAPPTTATDTGPAARTDARPAGARCDSPPDAGPKVHSRPEPAIEVTTHGAGPAPRGVDRQGLVVALTALLAWGLLMPAVGALATATVVTLALLLRDRTVPTRVALAVGLLLPPLIWLAFTRLAGTPLPGF